MTERTDANVELDVLSSVSPNDVLGVLRWEVTRMIADRGSQVHGRDVELVLGHEQAGELKLSAHAKAALDTEPEIEAARWSVRYYLKLVGIFGSSTAAAAALFAAGIGPDLLAGAGGVGVCATVASAIYAGWEKQNVRANLDYRDNAIREANKSAAEVTLLVDSLDEIARPSLLRRELIDPLSSIVGVVGGERVRNLGEAVLLTDAYRKLDLQIRDDISDSGLLQALRASSFVTEYACHNSHFSVAFSDAEERNEVASRLRVRMAAIDSLIRPRPELEIADELAFDLPGLEHIAA